MYLSMAVIQNEGEVSLPKMLHATVKDRAEKIQVRELKCHRQNTEHKGDRDRIVTRKAVARVSQSVVPSL